MRQRPQTPPDQLALVKAGKGQAVLQPRAAGGVKIAHAQKVEQQHTGQQAPVDVADEVFVHGNTSAARPQSTFSEARQSLIICETRRMQGVVAPKKRFLPEPRPRSEPMAARRGVPVGELVSHTASTAEMRPNGGPKGPFAVCAPSRLIPEASEELRLLTASAERSPPSRRSRLETASLTAPPLCKPAP